MELFSDQYFHIYNRSNNNEIVFKSNDNYLYFLQKYQSYFEVDFHTLAYCLMPTHFHFLVMVKAVDTERLKNTFGMFLSSYTKAINKQLGRHGSLFQQHTKSRCIDDERYLITLVAYIHQNPIRAGLVDLLEDWEFSSYCDYSGKRDGISLSKEYVMRYFGSIEEFKRFSGTMLQTINKKYWI